jgi:hypothetical protein
MSNMLNHVADGDLVDFRVTFISKRTELIRGERVVVLTLELDAGDHTCLAVGPSHLSLTYGWSVGQDIELYSALVTDSTLRTTDCDCSTCGNQLHRQSALARAPIAEELQEAVTGLDDRITLVAIPGTALVSGRHLESSWRQTVYSLPAWLESTVLVCPRCDESPSQKLK